MSLHSGAACLFECCSPGPHGISLYSDANQQRLKRAAVLELSSLAAQQPVPITVRAVWPWPAEAWAARSAADGSQLAASFHGSSSSSKSSLQALDRAPPAAVVITDGWLLAEHWRILVLWCRPSPGPAPCIELTSSPASEWCESDPGPATAADPVREPTESYSTTAEAAEKVAASRRPSSPGQLLRQGAMALLTPDQQQPSPAVTAQMLSTNATVS
jgi:hypothetical protein